VCTTTEREHVERFERPVLWRYRERTPVADAVHRTRDRLACKTRIIAMPAQVREHDGDQPGMVQLAGEAGGCTVREVAVTRSDALLHGPRVGAAPEQRIVVVRFQHEQVTTRQRGPHRRGWPAEIRGHAHTR